MKRQVYPSIDGSEIHRDVYGVLSKLQTKMQPLPLQAVTTCRVQGLAGFLYSKSPIARATASIPLTRPYATMPPQLLTRADSRSLSGL